MQMHKRKFPYPLPRLHSTVRRAILAQGGWFSARHIAEKLGYSPRYVAQQLDLAHMEGLVEWQHNRRGRGWRHLYRLKHYNDKSA